MNENDKTIAKPAIEPLIALLRDKTDPTKRAAAAYLLGQIGDMKAVEPLISAYQDSDARVRRDVIRAFGNIDDPRRVTTVIAALTDQDEEVQEEAINSLDRMPDPRASEALVYTFRNPTFIHKTISALECVYYNFKDSGVIAALLGALANDNPNIVSGAIRALAHFDQYQLVDRLAALLNADDALVRVNAAKALIEMRVPNRKTFFVPMTERFIADLQDTRPQVRELASAVLEEVGDERAVAPLLVVLQDDDERARRAAANALGRIGNRNAVDALLNALKDESWWVREAAARALGKIGDTSAVSALIEALGDDESWVRANAVWALGAIKDERAVEALIDAVRHPDSSVGRRAAYVLRKVDDERALNAIRSALGDPDQSVRHTAQNVLRSLGLDSSAQGDSQDAGQVLAVQVRACFYALREALHQLEDRLIEFGFDERLVHDWVFNIDDLLDEWQGRQLDLAEICGSSDMRQVPKLLDSFAAYILYVDEVEMHMKELERLVAKVLPEEEPDEQET